MCQTEGLANHHPSFAFTNTIYGLLDTSHKSTGFIKCSFWSATLGRNQGKFEILTLLFQKIRVITALQVQINKCGHIDCELKLIPAGQSGPDGKTFFNKSQATGEARRVCRRHRSQMYSYYPDLSDRCSDVSLIKL